MHPSTDRDRDSTHPAMPGLMRIMVMLAVCLLPCACQKQSPELLRKSLFGAVQQGNVALVEKCIAARVDLNSPEMPDGWSALHYAARAGNEQVVRMLLDAGADPDYVGTAPCESEGRNLVVSFKPIALAQSMVYLAENIETNPGMASQINPDMLAKIRAPGALERYRRIEQMLKAVTHGDR